MANSERACGRRSDRQSAIRNPRFPSFLHLYILIPVTRATGAQPRVDESIQIAVEHALGVAGAYSSAQVLHHLIRLKHVAPDLAAPADFTLLAVELIHLRAL